MPKTSPLDTSLIAAVEGRQARQVEQLLSEGANPNARKGKKTVFEIADRRDTRILAALIRAGAWNKSVQGMTVWAITEKLPDVLKILLEKGADPNAKSLLGTTLEVAAERGDLESLEHLLTHGADPDAGDSYGTPLMAALAHQQGEVAERLLEAGASAGYLPVMKTTTPLALASAFGPPTIVERLLSAGADPNHQCARVATRQFGPSIGGPETYALLVAAERGHAEVVLMLLDAGARPEVRDGHGRGLFELATAEVKKALARAGFQPAARPPAEELLLAAEQGNSERVSELLAAGAPADARDSRKARKGWTPLMLAAAAGHQACVSALLNAAAPLEAAEEGDEQMARMLAGESDPAGYRRDFEATLGRTALGLAIEGGHESAAMLLLEAGANPLLKDFLGDTPLTLAVEAGMLEFLQLAHARGVPLEGKGRAREDVLAVACEKGHGPVVRLLLETRPKISSKDLNKALLKACSRCDTDTARILLERGATAAASDAESGTAWCAAIGASRYVAVSPDEPQRPGSIRVWNEHGVSVLLPYPEERILAMMDLLRPHGGDLDKDGPLGPPFLLAVKAGLCAVVGKLVDWGIKPHPEAMKMAELYGQTEMMETLRVLGAAASPATPPESEPEPSRYQALRPPSFARAGKAPAFLSAVDKLAATCQGKVTPFPSRAGAFLVQVKAARQDKLNLPELQADYLAQGYYLVGYGSPGPQGPDKLAIFPSPDPYHALAAIAPNGVNYDVGPGNIKSWFVEREKEGRSFVFTALGHDLVVGQFRPPVDQADHLAVLMYELCPDTVDQGVGSLEELASLLAQDGKFYLWWD